VSAFSSSRHDPFDDKMHADRAPCPGGTHVHGRKEELMTEPSDNGGPAFSKRVAT
jgi:hypothetical protein